MIVVSHIFVDTMLINIPTAHTIAKKPQIPDNGRTQLLAVVFCYDGQFRQMTFTHD